MRDPTQAGVDGSARYPRALQTTAPIAVSPPPRRRLSAAIDIRRTNSAANRAIIAIVLVLLLAILTYLLTLSANPSVTELSPAPGTTTEPGPVLVEAHVTAAKPIQHVILTVDGQTQIPAVITQDDRDWIVRFQGVLSQGKHQATIEVEDSDGNAQHHSWSFIAAGPRVSPTIVVSDPPTGATVLQGVVRLGVQIGSDASITSELMTINGEQIPVVPQVNSPAAKDAGRARQLSLTAEHEFAVGSYVAHITATDAQGDTAVLDWPFTVTDDPAQATARYFASTKIYVVGQFKAFWEAHDGSELFGDPISTQFIDDHGTTVQYFQNARFELGPDNKIHLGLVGDEALGSTQPKVPKPKNFTGLYFNATGHTLAGKFKDFWTKNGGVDVFGYPISEVVDQNGTKVQYFERARFVLAPGSDNSTVVQLTPLGQQLWSSLNLKNGSTN